MCDIAEKASEGATQEEQYVIKKYAHPIYSLFLNKTWWLAPVN
jgi:hypothetical protein